MTSLTLSAATIHGKFRAAAEAGENRIDILHGLMLRLGELFDFDPDPPDKDSEDDRRAGAADLAHAFVGGARALGIPARYVTGYYFGEDAGDPAHRLGPTDRHIRLAVGLDSRTTLPVRASPAAEEAEAGKVVVRPVSGDQSQQQSQ
jgi:transglutaminase-like putative cysteine protease